MSDIIIAQGLASIVTQLQMLNKNIEGLNERMDLLVTLKSKGDYIKEVKR